jgi:hypothetical protein
MFFYLGFLLVVIPPVSFVCSIAFLVFFVGLVDYFEGLISTSCLNFGTFFEITSTFHSSEQSFIAHYTYSSVT